MFHVLYDKRTVDTFIRQLDTWGDFVEEAAKDFHSALTAELERTAPVDTGNLKRHIKNKGVGRWGNTVAGLTVVDVEYAYFVNHPPKQLRTVKRGKHKGEERAYSPVGFVTKASRKLTKRLITRLSQDFERHFRYSPSGSRLVGG